jgi:hypothetical protein
MVAPLFSWIILSFLDDIDEKLSLRDNECKEGLLYSTPYKSVTGEDIWRCGGRRIARDGY